MKGQDTQMPGDEVHKDYLALVTDVDIQEHEHALLVSHMQRGQSKTRTDDLNG